MIEFVKKPVVTASLAGVGALVVVVVVVRGQESLTRADSCPGNAAPSHTS